MLTLILIIVLIVLAAFIIKELPGGAEYRGKKGERTVASKLYQLPQEYRIFNDIYIQREGRSTQIDHVVVSPYGVFCIETKNYSGLIYGGTHSDQWTQNIYGHKYYFNNPLRQNGTHVKALVSLLQIPAEKIVPIVVFLRDAIMMNHVDGNVMDLGVLLGFIRSFSSIIFSEDEVVRMSLTLNSLTTDSPDAKHDKQQRHLITVQQNIIRKEFKVANGVCPSCGGRLMVRQGRYGNFIGCSNYPRCRFTRQM